MPNFFLPLIDFRQSPVSIQKIPAFSLYSAPRPALIGDGGLSEGFSGFSGDQ